MSLAPPLEQELSTVLKDSAQRRTFSRLQQRLAERATFVAAALSVFVTFTIVYILLSQSFIFFRSVSLVEFFTAKRWNPMMEPGQFGIPSLISGTLLITLGSSIIAIPFGLLVGTYLSEYAKPKVRTWLKPALELLAGIPTVVYGYLGLFVITPLMRKIMPGIEVYNAASGAIVVGIMVLPMVSSLCEDAIRAVPRALREGAAGLGATKAEIIIKVVLPAALSGIVASFILAISRAIGETMAVTLAAGAAPKLTLNPFESVQTMTAFIVTTASGDERPGSVPYNSMYAVGATLFCLTFTMNVIARRLVRKYRRVY